MALSVPNYRVMPDEVTTISISRIVDKDTSGRAMRSLNHSNDKPPNF